MRSNLFELILTAATTEHFFVTKPNYFRICTKVMIIMVKVFLQDTRQSHLSATLQVVNGVFTSKSVCEVSDLKITRHMLFFNGTVDSPGYYSDP